MTTYRNATGILLAMGVLALAAPAPADDADGEKRGPRRAGWIEKYDADGDGKLSDAERDAAKAEWKQKRSDLLEKYDADGDGKLSREERGKARADGALGGPRWGERKPQGEPGEAPGPPSEGAEE